MTKLICRDCYTARSITEAKISNFILEKYMPPDMPKVSSLQMTQDDLTLVDILLFARRRWLVICTPALIATVTIAVIATMRAPVYQSTAILDVPSETTPELKRFLPTPQAYLLVLESPTTKKELACRLKAKQVMSDNANYVLRARITAAAPLAMLEITAESSTAAAPAAIIEEWAELFQERIRQIIAEAAIVKNQSSKSQSELHTQQMARLQNQEMTIEGDFVKKLADTVHRFEKMCIEHRQQTEDLLLAENNTTTDATAAYETETEKLIREPDFKNSLTAMKIHLDALRKTYGILQEEQAKVMFQVPQSDDASERLQQLTRALDSCGENLQALIKKLQEEQIKRNTLERNRVTGLRKLKDEHATRKAKISALRSTQLAGLEQQRDVIISSRSQSKKDRLASLSLNIAAKQKVIDELGTELPSNPQQEVRVLTPAFVPAQPQPLGLTKYILMGLFGGWLLGLVVAVVLEVSARAFQQNQATTSVTPS
ncbi:MAG: hypothetical protein V1899_08700 [Planctomycetota bacterium]